MVRTSHVAKQSIKLQSVYIRNFYIKTQFSPIIILFISFYTRYRHVLLLDVYYPYHSNYHPRYKSFLMETV